MLHYASESTFNVAARSATHAGSFRRHFHYLSSHTFFIGPRLVVVVVDIQILTANNKMVIANSDSTSTLVSLDHALKRVSSLEALSVDSSSTKTAEYFFRQTELYLPEEEDLVEFDDDESSKKDVPLKVPIYLAVTTSSDNNKNNTFGADECLRCLPGILEAGDQLLAEPVVQYSAHSKNKSSTTTSTRQEERLLYVAQGEMAHAVASQCDVVVSDRATTCHILAVRSTSNSDSSCCPLVSLTHLDAPNCYDACLRDMMQHHEKHHNNNFSSSSKTIQMDIHIVGGFEDAKGSSRDISNWLLHLLADLAEEFADTISMTLRHCLITCMNDDGSSSSSAPLARGLAIHVPSGRVFLAKCAHDRMGPAMPLRSARLWAANNNKKHIQLSLVHTTTTTTETATTTSAVTTTSNHDSIVQIEPFQLRAFSSLPTLLALPDALLLRYCSTSPDCEEDDFCISLRQTLQFIQAASADGIIIFDNDKPLRFQRRGRNTWQRLSHC